MKNKANIVLSLTVIFFIAICIYLLSDIDSQPIKERNDKEETKVKTANSTHNEINTPSKPLHIGNQIVDKMPMFEACKDVVTEEQIKCFKNNLDKHVSSTFTYPPSALEQGIQGRVNVNFRINIDGTITVVDVKGSHPLLENEAKRIIEKLPKLKPAELDGKPIAITFQYPINFKYQ
ncbi:energy transducer TonB [Capnocytophaga haemolytica]|jgi:tonB family C-terminal domain